MRRPIRPAGHPATAPGHIITLELSTPDAHAAGEPRRTVACLSVRHGWLRRNAVSPHGVRLSGAPGAPLRTVCSSVNRTLAGKLPRHGIVAVPRVFDAGCSAILPNEGRGQPGRSARTGDAGERCRRLGAPRPIYLAFGHLVAHGGTHSVAAIWISGGYQSNAKQLWPRGGRYTGSKGLAGSPRRPKIMEGP